MRREIEALLAEEDEPGLIDRPVWSAASDLMEPAPALAPGTALGPYQIDRLVGEGGMGQIFRAVDVRLNRTVAVKVLPPSDAIDPLVRKRFGREAQAGASLAHPHICTLYDVGSRDGVDFIVMEYPRGGHPRGTPRERDRCRSIARFNARSKWPMRSITRIATGSCTGT